MFEKRSSGSRIAAARTAVKWIWAVALAGLVAGTPLLAEEPAPEDPTAPEALAEQVRAELASGSRRWIGIARIRASYPQRVSVGLGVLAARLPVTHGCAGLCDYRGLVMQVEPGLAGGQIGIGWARLVGERRGSLPVLSDIFIGWGVRAVVLRTWGEASVTPPDQTLVGIEGQFSVTRVGLSIGVLRRVSPSLDEDRHLITGGIGWGF